MASNSKKYSSSADIQKIYRKWANFYEEALNLCSKNSKIIFYEDFIKSENLIGKAVLDVLAFLRQGQETVGSERSVKIPFRKDCLKEFLDKVIDEYVSKDLNLDQLRERYVSGLEIPFKAARMDDVERGIENLGFDLEIPSVYYA